MNFRSNLSGAVAQQLGRLQGEAESMAKTKLLQILKNLDVCPAVNQLQPILAQIEAVDALITKYSRLQLRYTEVATRLDRPITLATTTVRILRTLPIPTSVAGVGVPIGLTNRYSKTLVDVSDFLDDLEADKRALLALVQLSRVDVSRIQSILQQVIAKLRKCFEDNPELQQRLNSIQRSQIQATPTGPDVFRTTDGRQFTLEVVAVPGGVAPLRFAQAKDREGIVVLRGPESYSASTQILLDELKFRIENQLA
jgi:septation ring formation regulator EzrA